MKDKRIRLVIAAFLFLIIAASILAVMPDKVADHDSGATAAELEISESVDDNVTSTSYVNVDGVVTDAIDMGYATVQRTRNTEGRVVEELYFDADGNPAKRYDDYYGVAYQYGNNIVTITYLYADGLPMMNSAGYAIIVRTVDSDGRAVDDYYYDLDMQPVYSSGYYGLHREYDPARQNNSVTYLDENGQQYERDEAGRISQITYLDADGNPAPTSAGYTILKRIYHRDGTAETDKYFDADGNPMALAKGQYGIKRSGKVNLLLDKNGNIMLCVDNILNGFPATVVVSGVIICVLMLLFPRKASIALTAAYMVFILYETLMFRETGDARTNFVLFSYADRFFTEQSVRVGVINNIWLFIPLGTGLYRNIQKRWGLLIPLLLSIAIETTQYITGLGIAEFDDVFGNTVGGWIGIASAYAAVRWNFETHIHDVAKRLERE